MIHSRFVIKMSYWISVKFSTHSNWWYNTIFGIASVDDWTSVSHVSACLRSMLGARAGFEHLHSEFIHSVWHCQRWNKPHQILILDNEQYRNTVRRELDYWNRMLLAKNMCIFQRAFDEVISLPFSLALFLRLSIKKNKLVIYSMISDVYSQLIDSTISRTNDRNINVSICDHVGVRIIWLRRTSKTNSCCCLALLC